MEKPKPIFRILIVEDDPERIAQIRSLIPTDIKIVVASSAGKAIGILERDRGNVYAGIMLDYNLERQPATEMDLELTGQHVVDAIIRNVNTGVPILIHSKNVS